MALTNESIRDWLNNHFPKDECEKAPLKGTYGLIWFLNAKHTATLPPSFAIKTVQPDCLEDEGHSTDVENIMREFRIWMNLPRCLNVVSAFGVEIASIFDKETQKIVKLPIMKMPRMQGSLNDWIEQPSEWDQCDRLIALTHALNGLQWLYQNGIQGHGDLKPSNFLYDDLNRGFSLDEAGNRWPSKKRSWIVKVSDLGWADAWVDYGLTAKAWRKYLAPERLDGTFVPVKSDIFAMGIIACELLTGKHPSGNVKSASSSDGKWKRWTTEGDRHLDGIEDEQLKNCIESALSAEPADRPTALEFQSIVMDCLHREYACDIRRTMEFYRKPQDNLTLSEHDLWTTTHIANLDHIQRSVAFEKFRKAYEGIEPTSSFENAEVWLNYACAMVELADKDIELPQLQLEIKARVRAVLAHALANMKKEEILAAKPQEHFSSWRPFERLSQLFTTGTDLIDDNGAIIKDRECNGYMLCAYHFSRAGRSRMHEDWASTDRHLNLAIAACPSEATPYHFKGYWIMMDNILQRRTMPAVMQNSRIAIATQAFKTAVELEPSWKEPKDELDDILKNHQL